MTSYLRGLLIQLAYFRNDETNYSDNLAFEDIMGVFMDFDNLRDNYLISTYSEGITLDKFSQRTPKGIKKDLTMLCARALADLHGNSEAGIVTYRDTVPTNIRFDGEKLIFNPHAYIESRSVLTQALKDEFISKIVEDLANMNYTHDFIDDPEEFIDHYIKYNVSPDLSFYENESEAFSTMYSLHMEKMEDLENGIGYIKPVWKKRGKYQIGERTKNNQ